MTKTISEDDALEYVYDNVAIQDVSEHRWYTRQLVVFRDDDGELWGFHYLDPASELQEDQDRFDSDPVEVFPVEGVHVTVVDYRRIESHDD